MRGARGRMGRRNKRRAERKDNRSARRRDWMPRAKTPRVGRVGPSWLSGQSQILRNVHQASARNLQGEASHSTLEQLSGSLNILEMGMSGPFLALTFLLLATTRLPVKACSCGPRHPQEDFCRSDMVVTARFLSIPQLNHTLSRLQYKIKVIKFKGFEVLGGITLVPKFLTTPAQESLCGYRHKALSKSQEYLIAARLLEGQLYVTSCSFVRPWSSLSPAQQLGFNQTYATGCGCQVQHCLNVPCNVESDTSCLWTDSLMASSGEGSQSLHLACLPRKSGLCSWKSLSAEAPQPTT
ncbi:metalloproteinase inhibitor 1 isoform X2 [Trichosurus vulpecula]|uniref:metalloproteinase inhibitor 1 isoform X2 n=1 Tax=Trichosurus vulpecula TaxID=9337 RepID=UPI00186ABC42|nr:metalloproteinase inhibitor 1 isoform X2 [Trichosurus vulpecula]